MIPGIFSVDRNNTWLSCIHTTEEIIGNSEMQIYYVGKDVRLPAMTNYLSTSGATLGGVDLTHSSRPVGEGRTRLHRLTNHWHAFRDLLVSLTAATLNSANIYR